MDAIICDISAWEYWCTPPAIRDVEIPIDIARAEKPDGLGLEWLSNATRLNARPLDASIRERLLTDLKGVTRPVHIMLPESSRHSSDFVIAHRVPKDLPSSCIVDLGNNLSVLSPSYLLVKSPRKTDPIALALAMFEACGIYAVSPTNERMSFAFDLLRREGALKENGELNPDAKICEYYGTDGRRASFLDGEGDQLPWSVCLPLGKTTSNLWKRPPLTSIEQLTDLAVDLQGKTGNRTITQALSLALDGSASPLESKIALFLTADMRFGGEGWPKPRLNQRISFDDAALKLAYQGHCVVDQLYPSTMGVVEVNGEGFHSGDLTFKKETGRIAALESMGYSVVCFTYDQVSDLEKYDSLIEQRAKTLGLKLANRTASFLNRRNTLHGKLFPTSK